MGQFALTVLNETDLYSFGVRGLRGGLGQLQNSRRPDSSVRKKKNSRFLGG